MLGEDEIAAHLQRIERDGYTVLERAIDMDLVDALASAVARLERELRVTPTPNSFEGAKSLRIYNLLARGAVFAQVPVHAQVLPLVERVLDPGCLVSSINSITICPGEGPQPIHTDDQLIPIARPHAPVVCNSIWPLTDFSAANGATRVVPGSHRTDRAPALVADFPTYRRLVRETLRATPVCMPRGSVLVYHGSLWHGGGPNRTGAGRTAIAMNYCAGFIRQQENQQLGIPRDVARRFSPRLRELIGYGIYGGLIGHIDKQQPATLLDGDAHVRLLFEAPPTPRRG